MVCCFVDEVMNNFFEILKEKYSGAIDVDDLSIDYGESLEKRLLKYMELCRFRAALLSRAKSVNDELAMQSPLLRLRSSAMGLSSLLNAIADDAEAILKTGGRSCLKGMCCQIAMVIWGMISR